MAFALPALVRLRPYLAHVTRPENLPSLRADPVLRPASVLAGDRPPRTDPRPDAVPVRFDGRTVLLNDQKPLRLSRVRFGRGWDAGRWLTHLDRRVFFWPLDRHGKPAAGAARHLELYRKLGGVVLVLPTAVLVGREADAEFSRCNSGATSRYAVVDRGADTFQPADRFTGSAAAVVEVTVLGEVPLPRPLHAGPGVLACGDAARAGAVGLTGWLGTPRTAPGRRPSGTPPAG